MKVARFVLKIVSLCLAVAALACCVIAYWDKITEAVRFVGAKCSRKTCCGAENDDYADWDD